MIDWKAEGATCVSLLQDLVRIPSVNRGTGLSDDGGEKACAERVADHLRAAGLAPKFFEKVENRTNVVTRIKGNGKKKPLLLNGHLDVVEADASAWRKDPFGGEISDGYLWGRGTIDMKNMVAMSTCVMAMLAREGKELDRDLIFAGVADEEAGCELGSLFLVNEHPEEVRAEYMLGEIGAFSLHMFGRTFYPMQVAEKGLCWVRATYEGDPGHGSMPNPDSAVIRLANGIRRLGKKRLPMHPTDVVRDFVGGLAKELPAPQKQVLARLTMPQVAGLILDLLIKDPGQKRAFGAMLSNTASPTIVRAGSKVNVIPSKATVDIDGRTLPGQSDAAFLEELRQAMGGEPKLEILRSLPSVTAPTSTPLFDHLSRTVKRHDPTAHPLPYLIPGFTDAKAYARLGTTCYGFSPVRFDPTSNANFSRMYHGHDERIPVGREDSGLEWGLKVLYEAVSGFCEAGT